jgi:hypothetical protein
MHSHRKKNILYLGRQLHRGQTFTQRKTAYWGHSVTQETLSHKGHSFTEATCIHRGTFSHSGHIHSQREQAVTQGTCSQTEENRQAGNKQEHRGRHIGKAGTDRT